MNTKYIFYLTICFLFSNGLSFADSSPAKQGHNMLILSGVQPAKKGRAFSTFHVNNLHPSASDSNPGTLALPWLTIQHAVNTAAAGDSILVHSGTYDGARIEKSGTVDNYIYLSVFQEDDVLLDAPGINNKHNSILEIETWEGTGKVSYWEIVGFEISDSPRYGIDMRHTSNITVKNNVVHNSSSTGIFTAFSDDVLIESNQSYENGEHGIYHSNSGDNPQISANVLHHNYSCGVHMNGDLSMGGDGTISNALVEANVIYENGNGGGSGINMDGVNYSTIVNNLVYDNHASGISLYQIDGAVCSHDNQIYHNTILIPEDGRWALNIPGTGCTGNEVFNNIFFSDHSFRGSVLIADPDLLDFECDYNIVVNRFSIDGGNSNINLETWQSYGYDLHSIISTPGELFINPGTGDFHLLENSPAVDAGKTVPDIVADIEGQPRPVGDGYDIGAYEYQSAEFVKIALKILLQGPYEDGLMSTQLKKLDLIPLVSPFTESQRTASSIPANTVDWILVQLRSIPSGATLSSRSFLLQNTGDIIDLDNSSELIIPDVNEGDYYIVIKHRNHLAAMSASALSLSENNSLFYNFTTTISQFYGSDGATELDENIWAMWGANTDSNFIDMEDFLTWESDALLGRSGYQNTDFNLDGIVNSDDYTLWYNNQWQNASSGLP